RNMNIPKSPQTPRSSTENVIRSAKLSINQASKVRKQLLLGNSTLAEIKSAKERIGQKRGGERNVLARVLGGKVIKKYRCAQRFGKITGLGRKIDSSSTSKSLLTADRFSKQRTCIRKRFSDVYLAFMTRDDNSGMEPGKA
ncbi:unnamed protein product, partial [Owenia fusiformis]